MQPRPRTRRQYQQIAYNHKDEAGQQHHDHLHRIDRKHRTRFAQTIGTVQTYSHTVDPTNRKPDGQ